MLLYQQGLSDDVKYSVNRLVQGLSSGRKFARQGFSTTLCQILRGLKNVDSSVILECMEDKAKNLLAGKPSKSVSFSIVKIYRLKHI